MTTEISSMHQMGYAGENLVSKSRERFLFRNGGLANEDVRHAVGCPLLRVQPEEPMFESHDQGPLHRTCDMSRTGVDRDHDAGALEDGGPLMKRQPAQKMRYVRVPLEVGRKLVALGSAGYDQRPHRRKPLDQQQRARE